MIGIGFEQRISDKPLSKEEYYLAGVMLGLGCLRSENDGHKFRIFHLLEDAKTEEEIALVKRYRDMVDAPEWKETDIFWIEEENAPLGAQQVRTLFHHLQREAIRKGYCDQPVAENEIFKQLIALDIEILSIETAREQIRQLAKQMEGQWGTESIRSLFTEPEAFREQKGNGNFASMNRRQFYKQNHNPKMQRMTQRQFRRKM
jgi:hypothetical protein